ncbi:MAG: HAD-IC family P-type ATPase [Oscillospiraceae bacterium]|nr:HAD-IC family P-type ATPase [Oscillospiraceae bacterium]
MNQPQNQLMGLSTPEVEQRLARGQSNTTPQGITPTIGEIILRNTLTLFNLISFAIFALIIIAGGGVADVMFIGVPVSNTFMGILQGWRSKITLDKLSILSSSKSKVLRNGNIVELNQNDIVLDDIILLSAGEQIPVDAKVVQTESFEVNEALLTGEQDNINKRAGDVVLSGSFVVAGTAYVVATAVGADNFANSLTAEAKSFKKKTTPLMKTLRGIIRFATVIIIPLGVLLFLNATRGPEDAFLTPIIPTSVLVLGMIPMGLIVLTTVTLGMGAVNLARHKALVQSLPSIETLARVDVLCLDKTGTITDGTLKFKELVLSDTLSEDVVRRSLAELMVALPDENATAEAIRGKYPGGGGWRATTIIPFSSARKWSGANFVGQGSFIVGAPQFVFPNVPANATIFKTVDEFAAQGLRVLCLAHSGENFESEQLPRNLKFAGLLVFDDNIRPEAPDTFRRFVEEGVTLKVISGDDALTVSCIAAKAGIKNAAQYVDMSQHGERADFATLSEKYTVFGRVTPHQKRELVRAMKKHGHATCMTGDGVNDVLAMKEADCSVAMVGGSSAARNAADFVLLNSNFSAMVRVMKEGRRVINNIENVASVYLVGMIYFMLLGLIVAFTGLSFPISNTGMMMPISFAAVAIPTFFLAMRANYNKPSNRFLSRVLELAVPAALSVVTTVLLVNLASNVLTVETLDGEIYYLLNSTDVSTMNVLIIGIITFAVVGKVSMPFNRWIAAMYFGSIALFFVMFIWGGDFLRLAPLWSANAFFYIPLTVLGLFMFTYLNLLVRTIMKKLEDRKEKKQIR